MVTEGKVIKGIGTMTMTYTVILILLILSSMDIIPHPEGNEFILSADASRLVDQGNYNNTTIDVLIHFSGTEYNWTMVHYPSEDNGTVTALNVTRDACNGLGMELNISESEYGAFINAIGGISGASDWSTYWSLLIWNGTSVMWEASMLGASSVYPVNGEAIAWVLGGWGDQMPYPTPILKEPEPL